MQYKRLIRCAPGATLIELLVLIGAISILTLILIVGLRSVKRTQLDMKDLHNLRSERDGYPHMGARQRRAIVVGRAP